MNAAARLVHQNIVSRQLVFARLLSGQQLTILSLTLAILLSALSVIYMTHLTRELHAQIQHSFVEQDRLHMEYGQLLLERSTWMMQARTQQIAENKLGMIVPDRHSVVVVRE
jgi:cell division protein FtsL